MRTRSLHLELVADDADGDAHIERCDSKNNQYARSRSARSPSRRSSRSSTKSVPLGIAARRNRRWSW